MPDRTPTRAEELDAIRLRDREEWSPDHAALFNPRDEPIFGWTEAAGDRRYLLARLDEAERLLREVEENMWDEEPLCAEIQAFLEGDAANPVVDEPPIEYDPDGPENPLDGSEPD